ncbi:MAG: PD40 domain-containing protein, partial [Pirellulales bacterium]|nr:PD40 domain-containing protein [Pirellulales bacterium]
MTLRIGIVLIGFGWILCGSPAFSANESAKEIISVLDDTGIVLEKAVGNDGSVFDEIVYAVRRSGSDHWYANFGFYACPTHEYPSQRVEGKVCVPPIYKEGGRLCRTNLRTGKTDVLIDDPKGTVRDPKVHYDGKTIVFSYRKGGRPYFNLYEIQADGTGLKQLTDGRFNDIEPTYLPDGGIMFCSDRCRRFVNCWRTPVAVLYRCDGDGRNIRMISSNIEHDNTPWVLPDGRVMYMRWEYVDRSQGAFHHLWTTNPDGTSQMVYYGNQRPGYVMIDAKPLPGSNKVVAIFSPGHGRPEHCGYVTIVDPNLGPDDPAGTSRICSDVGLRDPYPLSQSSFLVAKGAVIYLLSKDGTLTPLCRLDKPGFALHEPRPLLPRPRERVISPRTDLRQKTGTLVLADIYHGRSMKGVQQGEVEKLLVLEQLPKPVN